MKTDAMSEADPINVSAAPAEVLSQLERIIASRSLAGSDQLQRLLILDRPAAAGGNPRCSPHRLGLPNIRQSPLTGKICSQPLP